MNIMFAGFFWALGDLNPGPLGYEPSALTDRAKGPYGGGYSNK